MSDDELRGKLVHAVADRNYDLALECIQKLIAPSVLLAISHDRGFVKKSYGEMADGVSPLVAEDLYALAINTSVLAGSESWTRVLMRARAVLRPS